MTLSKDRKYIAMPMALLPAHCQPIASLSPAHPQELASCSQGIHHELFPLIDLMRRLDLVGSNVAFFTHLPKI
jgi:hypothetical protein